MNETHTCLVEGTQAPLEGVLHIAEVEQPLVLGMLGALQVETSQGEKRTVAFPCQFYLMAFFGEMIKNAEKVRNP